MYLYIFENKQYLFSLKPMNWCWQWHSITWLRRLFLRPESRDLYLVTPPTGQIQHSSFLGPSFLCTQAKFQWKSRCCSDTKSSASNNSLQIEDFATGLQTCSNFLFGSYRRQLQKHIHINSLWLVNDEGFY